MKRLASKRLGPHAKSGTIEIQDPHLCRSPVDEPVIPSHRQTPTPPIQLLACRAKSSRHCASLYLIRLTFRIAPAPLYFDGRVMHSP